MQADVAYTAAILTVSGRTLFADFVWAMQCLFLGGQWSRGRGSTAE